MIFKKRFKKRREKEIGKELVRFADRVWLERHLSLKDRGFFEQYTNSDDITKQEIAAGAFKSEKKMREKYKDDALFQNIDDGITDFEWGMICGKLSMLRWYYGEEWDSLHS